MADEGWLRVKELFGEALERSENERTSFLDDSCDDPQQRSRVEALLAAHDDAGAFLEGSTVTELVAPAGTTEDEAIGKRIGRYTIRSVIAAGGMGVVYEAEQEQPHRTVALKVLRHGMGSRAMARRFRQEAEVLGRLRHPGIAQVYDAGTVDEGEGARPWFALELIRGRSLLEHCESGKLGPRQRLELFTRVCDAVQYAHHQGIIHRDLKPDNILVDEHGEPKILDFGVARLTDSDIQVTTMQTDLGQLIGTVPYMSPEQTSGDLHALDTRSDVYALGVVLYELLAGKLPYDLRGKSIPQALRVIGEAEPSRLSSISRVFRGDLDTIVAKALEKEKGRRYQTAADLAADLQHYLKDEPIVARPASTFYQLRKFAKRNKPIVAGVVVAFAALVLGMVGIAWKAVEARAEASRALLVKEFLGDMIAATDFAETGRRITIGEVLDDAADNVGEAFAGEPVIEAEIRHVIGLSYASMSELPKSVEQLRLALEIRRRELGEEHPDTLESAHRLAEKLRESWLWPDAEKIVRQVVDARRRTLGDRHRDTLRSISLLADLLVANSRLDEAEQYAREAIDGFSDIYGAESEQVILARKELSEVHGLLEQFGEAKKMGRENLAIAQRALGNDHWVTIDVKRILGVIYDAAGEWDEAEPLMRASLEERQRLFGDRDIVALGWLDLLGWNLYKKGEVEQGEAMIRQALEQVKEYYGENNLPTLYATKRIGHIEWRRGNLQEAEDILRRCLDIQREALGAAHPHVPDSASDLAWLLCVRGKLDEAETTLRQSLELQQRVNGPDHPWTRRTSFRLGRCLLAQKRYAEAEPLLLYGHSGVWSAVVENEGLRERVQTLIDLYDAWSKPEKAAEYRGLVPAPKQGDASE
ncbi:MAG: tetratricopeptide repeat protein [Planctomycetota bacterium]|jgi:tetratricopeptide (TPR) repeat protein/tRNA A-37 threonylcarbamoyl transferase component Bud32